MSWKNFLIILIASYQKYLSPILVVTGLSQCRFSPTCSEYCAISIKRYGPVKGIGIWLKRIARCHPF